MTDPMGGWILPLSMFSLMFGMGLTLTPNDFRRIAGVPGPVIAGTLLQLVGMPVIGVALALAFDMSAMLAVGLVVVSACPGGMASNVMVHYGRANTALSITLTATATAATLLTLPLWIRGILGAVGGAASEIEVPLLATARDLGGLTILPVLVGMWVRYRWPTALALERRLTAIGGLGVFGTLGYAGAIRPDPPTAEFEASLLPAILLVLASMVVGVGVPWLLRQSFSDIVTIAIEVTVKNGLLGMVVVSSTFGLLEPNIPIFIYTSIMFPFAICALMFHRSRAARDVASA